MTNALIRGVVAATLAALAPLASAHEFTCSALAGILTVRQDGVVVTTSDGMPVPLGTLQPALTVSSYPANIGVQVTLRNVASEPSVSTGSWDTLDSTGGAPAEQFPLPPIGGGQMAPPFAAGTTLPVGGSIVGWFAYRVMNQQECLHAFGGQADAAVCTNDETDFRFVATHDVGSTECRARIVCGAQPVVLAPPPPPPSCPTTWHGVKQFGTANGDTTSGIALDQQCDVDVSGYWNWNVGSSSYLGQLAPDGTLRQILPWQGWEGTAVAVDLDGRRFLAWNQSWNPQGGGGGNVTMFGPSGGWTTHVAGTLVKGVAVDVAGDVYAAGIDSTATGLAQAVVAKLSAADGTLVWTRQLLASDGGGAFAVALDQAGNVLVTGEASGVFEGQLAAGAVGTPDAFVAKLNPGGVVLWGRLLGTSAPDTGNAIAADAAGNVYVGGTTVGAFPGYTYAGDVDAFVAKLDAAGNPLWVRQFGSARGDEVRGVAADAAGNVWAVGYTEAGLPGATAYGSEDAFVTKLDPMGNTVFLTEFGTAAVDAATGVALDDAGDAFVSGATQGDFGGGAAGGWDAFVAKFDPLGNLE